MSPQVRNMTKMIEILAPAGSVESLKAAVAAGADAVYMGGSRFGARAYAENPDEDGLLEALDYVHLHGRKLYLTVNTLVKDEELEGLVPWLKPYYERGLDAVLVQDLGVLREIRRHFPDLPLHASTQIIICPGYDYKIVRMLVTNFHQPQSTLLLLVSAFVGGDWRKIYDYALAHDFRFLSYGDSSLLIPKLKTI